jgi:LysR family transcriptional activator of nhaA
LADVVPKSLAYEVLRSTLGLADPPKLVVYEGKFPDLLADLGRHRLDLVISDAPSPPTAELKVYNHLLGECGLSWMAVPKLAAAHRRGFPQSLNGAPCLLPTEHTAVRRALDHWLSEHDIFPQVIAEFEDSALLKMFGEAGEGIFPVPTAIEAKVIRQLGVATIGIMPEVHDRFYAISAEKRVQHPATLAIVRQARTRLFEPGNRHSGKRH